MQRATPRASRKQLEVTNFKFLKQLGLKKPGFLPDFGKDKRLAVLNRFYTNIDKTTYDELLADSFKLTTAAAGHSTYGKADYTKLMTDMVKPAIPNFSWGHATSGDKSDDGYSIVTVQATGHHTDKALEFPGRKAIPSSGNRFKLEEETQRVKVEDGQIQEIVVLPNKGAGPLALYVALGGKA
ncbi:hypothetical protein WJX74_003010 [Apatococcus lobatus]